MSDEFRKPGIRRVGQVKEVTSLTNPIIKDIKALKVSWDRKVIKETKGHEASKALEEIRVRKDSVSKAIEVSKEYLAQNREVIKVHKVLADF